MGWGGLGDVTWWNSCYRIARYGAFFSPICPGRVFYRLWTRVGLDCGRFTEPCMATIYFLSVYTVYLKLHCDGVCFSRISVTSYTSFDIYIPLLFYFYL